MSMEIRKIDIGSGIGSSRAADFRKATELQDDASGEANGASFGDFLQKLAQDANTAQLTADQKLQEVAAGRNKDLHSAVLSLEKADIQFRMLTQVRNKVIEAYKEIMRMQV